MTDFAAYVVPLALDLPLNLTGSLDDGLAEHWNSNELGDPLSDALMMHSTSETKGNYAPHVEDFTAHVVPVFDQDWFERIVVNPSRIDLGNLLAGQVKEVEIASTYTHESQFITDITNLVGTGAEIVNLPTFPHEILPFGNFIILLTVSPVGPPVVDGDIEIDVGGGATIVIVPVTGQRAVVFPIRPQAPFVETLEWFTDVIESYNGTEQRISVRESPRQRFEFQSLATGQQDMLQRALIFDWLARVWAVPVWFEQQELGVTVPAGSSTIPCDTTAGDFRVGGLIMLYSDSGTFEAFLIDSMTDTEITVDGQTIHEYQSTDIVMPVRNAFAKTQLSHRRLRSNHEYTGFEFVTLDNVNLADTTGLPTYDSRIILDDPNFMGGNEVEEQWSRDVVVLDNVSGRVSQTSRVDRSSPRFKKRWETISHQDTFTVRKLLHALRGSQVTFWLPSFRDDLTLTQSIAGNGITMRVATVGFPAYIQARRPMTDIRVTFTNGTTASRRVTGAETDGDEDVLTLSSSLSAAPITPAQVQRIELLHLVRITDDKAVFTHLRAGEAIIEINVVGVKD